MLDPYMRRIIDPPLNILGRQLAKHDIKADQITWLGFACGLLSAFLIAWGFYTFGLILLCLNRLCDGLDGAAARASGVSDVGGFLDITLDFIVYAGIVLGFAFADPDKNALSAAILLFAFIGTMASFLAFAIFAARHGLKTRARGMKAFYYLGGLAEGTETFLFFVAFCLWPQWFVIFSAIFTLLCLLTTISRIMIGIRTLKGIE